MIDSGIKSHNEWTGNFIFARNGIFNVIQFEKEKP